MGFKIMKSQDFERETWQNEKQDNNPALDPFLSLVPHIQALHFG